MHVSYAHWLKVDQKIHNHDIDLSLLETVELLLKLSKLEPVDLYGWDVSGDKAWMTVPYGEKCMFVYFQGDGEKPRVEFSGPAELDGGSGTTTLLVIQRALEVMSAGGDPECEVRATSSDWQTRKEYEGLT